MTKLEEDATTTGNGRLATISSRIKNTHISFCLGKTDRKNNVAPIYDGYEVDQNASVYGGRTDGKGGDRVNYESSFG